MSESEIIETLSGVPDSHPVWRAVMAVLEQHQSAWDDVASSPGLRARDRHFNAGAVAACKQLREGLQGLRKPMAL